MTVTESAPETEVVEPDPVVLVALRGTDLGVTAATLDDVERTRISAENRLRSMTRDETDSDGIIRGLGLPTTPLGESVHPEVNRVEEIVSHLIEIEKMAIKDVERSMRRHPLGPWVRSTIGIGDKQAARLLAAIGDPYWNTLHDRERTVSELWAYCGLHTVPAEPDLSKLDEGEDPPKDAPRVAARRRRGVRANWSNTAKMRAYLIASSCIKHAKSPYRKVYDERRDHTAQTHPDWTAGHSHNDALRRVAKAVLKDLWIQARNLHHPDRKPEEESAPVQ